MIRAFATPNPKEVSAVSIADAPIVVSILEDNILEDNILD